MIEYRPRRVIENAQVSMNFLKPSLVSTIAFKRFVTFSVNRASVSVDCVPLPFSLPFSLCFSEPGPCRLPAFPRPLCLFSSSLRDLFLSATFTDVSGPVIPRTNTSSHRTRSSSARTGSIVVLCGGCVNTTQAFPSCSSGCDRDGGGGTFIR